ncbi:MAG: DUF2007 domain-containing protein [Bacteroidales bacterium]|nr:DUF2007 domain-containing protein [Bacteroidales bacterium]
MKDGEYKTVARYTDAVSAHIAEGMLLENGIPAVVFGEVSSYPSLNVMDSIELKVFEADYETALALLNAPSGDAPADAE